MKKLMYIALVALAALTACSKVEMDSYAPARKVTFQAAVYVPQTKANASVWDEFTTNGVTSFSAKAFLHAEGYTSETQNFFGAAGETITPYQSNGTAATSETNVSYWGPSHDYYWPKGSTSYINFIAWKGTAPSVPDENTMSWTGYEVSGSSVLLYADKAWHYNANTANGTQYDGDAVTSGVPMLFRHALAQLCFKAVTNYAGSDKTVKITSFSLSGVYNHGSLSLSNNTDPGSTDTKEWTLPTGKVWTTSGSKISLPSSFPSGGVIPDADGEDLIAMQTILPQTVTSDMVITLNYQITTTVGSEWYSIETVSVSKNLSEITDVTSWKMGYQITYTLTFDLSANTIKINPTVENWNTEGGSMAVE